MSSTVEVINLGVNGGTPGADSNDYVLFDSTAALPGGLAAHGINRITFDVNNSQAGTRKAYWSQNKGTNWTLYDSTAVAAYSSPTDAGPFDYLVDTYSDWKLVWANGGSAQSTWLPVMKAIRGDRASGT